MTVTCGNFVQFMVIVGESIKKGLQFTADYDKLTIEYTGGY